jgi:hypothetical protein
MGLFEGIQSVDGFAATLKSWQALEIMPSGGANYFAVIDE